MCIEKNSEREIGYIKDDRRPPGKGPGKYPVAQYKLGEDLVK